MPPSHSFWVILIGKTATSFRGKEREDLVPTLRQLQRTQTDVTLRWYERGKVWESPEAAIGAAKLAETTAREKRTKEWRPGGEHRDPKARFELTRDEKRAKFKRDQSRPDRPDGKPPTGDDRPQSPFGPREPRAPRAPRPASDRPWPDRPKFDRPGPGRSPFGDRSRPPRGESRDRPPRSDNRDRGDRSERPSRPFGPPAENPFKDRARSDRPAPRPERRPPTGRPGGPSRPSGDRGGFKPPKRRS